jgi:hypothetical protein
MTLTDFGDADPTLTKPTSFFNDADPTLTFKHSSLFFFFTADKSLVISVQVKPTSFFNDADPTLTQR